ncbi:corrinoid ABC transporter substrate-binding protein [Methyloligella halotolerans]|uniref:Corrinoid ABC transporter substrate-binding protein n=1 Tax=Methyloligella halotolerans TaxID=1177755 RepID=A0A1E2S1F5_9HYPH|nr:cobalamin-binding protein [Methyloligella halotolerans]ODA68168.1 corrinoid ABC transporter substrate-binding protein [Methyloligella halotolerans]
MSEIAPNTKPDRIVSLIASATEIICALGARDRLVGRSHECDYPGDVLSLPQLTEAKFPVAGTSYDIDQRVKAIVQEGLSVYRVDAEALEALDPDVIVTQDHCEVCAVSLSDVEDAVCTFAKGPGGQGAEIVSLHPDSLADIWSDIRKVAKAIGDVEAGEQLIEDARDRMTWIAGLTAKAEGKPRIAMIEWIDPLMGGGNWMPELVELASGIDFLAKPGEPSPWVEWDDIRNTDPEVIFVHPCGFDIARTLEEMPSLEQRPGWNDLKAVRENKVFVADGNQYFNRPGPRVVESLQILAEILHSDLFPPSFEGKGWVRYDGSSSAASSAA